MRFRRFFIGVTLAACLPLTYACGVNIIRAVAAEPKPRLYSKLQDGTVRIDVFDVPAARVCSPLQGHRDLCVDHLRESLGQGLVDTLGRFMKPGGQDANYSAEFALIGFQQAPSATTPSAVRVGMRWKFTLKRLEDGVTVIALDETTVAPQELVRADLANEIVMSIINYIFERIGAELGAQDLSGKPPAPPPAEEAPPPSTPQLLCVPNSTQECVGPGACRGGQSCLPDGSGYTECDCGPSTKKKSSGSKPTPAPAGTPAAPASSPAELSP